MASIFGNIFHFHLFAEGSSNYTTCVIKGDSNSAQLAAAIINNFIENFNDGEDFGSDRLDGFEFQVCNI